MYCLLIRAAQLRGRIRYEQVAQILGIKSRGNHMAREVGQVLGEICVDEHKFNRPMLSAVVPSGNGVPGDGFFVMAKRLGRISDEKSSKRNSFWEAELESVYQVWKPKSIYA